MKKREITTACRTCSSSWTSAISRSIFSRRLRPWASTKRNSVNGSNERLRQFVGYLRRFQDAVDYNRFKELGFPIGSGEVESTHRSVPQKRLNLPEPCWHPDSINPMLALLVARANEWWDDYWAQRTTATTMAA
jgi:hypothetical protein